MNKKGWERNTVLVWTSCLVMIGVVSLLILPKLVQSGMSITTVQACALYTVQPVLCTAIEGDEKTPWRANVQMSAPLDPNLQGTLTAVRASVGRAYMDVRALQEGFPPRRGEIIRVQIVGNRNGSVPANAQVVVDSMYALPSGSTTVCRSLPLTCTS